LRRRRALRTAPRPAGPGGSPPLAGRRRRPREAGRPDRRHARPVARPHPGRAARRLRRPAGPDAVATELKRGLAARSFAPQVGTDGASALKQRAPAGRTLAPLKSAQAASARGASDSAHQEGLPMLKVAIQMDPLEAVNVESDTTFLMALTGQARGHKLWVYDFRTLALEDGRLFCRARPVRVQRKQGDHADFGLEQRLDLAEDVDVILMRQDPPFDMAYVTATYLLERVHPRTLVVNDPAEVRSAPEKLIATLFPGLQPPTLVSS